MSYAIRHQGVLTFGFSAKEALRRLREEGLRGNQLAILDAEGQQVTPEALEAAIRAAGPGKT